MIAPDRNNKDKTRPLVTVLVTSYKHERFVEDCIVSILAQTYSNIELIVIDDESPDNSLVLIAALSHKYGFEVISQKNTGLIGVLNRGIALATGKYFVSIGSDDLMCPNRIGKQVALMEARQDVAVCAGNCTVIDEHGVAAKKQRTVEERELDFRAVFLHGKPGIKAPTAMIRKSVFEEVGVYDPGIKLEDSYMWLKITSAGHKIYALADVVACYRKHGENRSKNMVFMADNIQAIYEEYKGQPDYCRILNRLLANLFNKSVKRGYDGSWDILKRISPRYYNFKLVFNILLLLTRPKKIGTTKT